MRLKNLYLLFLLFSLASLNAQDHPTCDGSRYLTDVFTDIEITEGVQFGSNTTFGGSQQDLFMDIYQPVGDTETSRPVIILAFGGSFITGERSDLDDLCKAYARKGFVAVTIDYRLYDVALFPLPSEEDMQDVVTKSVADFKAAIRFMREDAAVGGNTYGIDSDQIFVGGISAGAIAAAHTAMMDDSDNFTDELSAIIQSNGGLEGTSSGNLQYSSEVQGLINLSGGIGEADWIDENDPPFYSVHDEFDGTVPYGEGFGNIFGFDIIYMEGSQIMAEVGDAIGVNNELRTIEGSVFHVGYMIGADAQVETVDLSAVFLYDLLCAEFVSSVEEENALSDLAIYPNPTTGTVTLKGLKNENVTIEIRDVLGQTISTVENAKELNLAPYGKGMYFLEIGNAERSETIIKKIVVE